MRQSSLPKSAGSRSGSVDPVTAGRDADFSRALARATELTEQVSEIKASENSIKLPSGSENTRLREVSREFESIFVNQMLKAMRKTVMKTGMMDGGTGEEVFTEMLDTEYSKSLAASGGFGLAEMIYKQLSRDQIGSVGSPALVDSEVTDSNLAVSANDPIVPKGEAESLRTVPEAEK
ncbi:MAG: hypothetical protein CVV64_03795 [Candidatus Wallbacteria bacterium HGW-Wallbacteria-1]|uniref:Flagellar protein FlgJ N-terminal domain-containing protein n=1 Tax=Candidatus Wallbacteria bacterium HGW-Wallbacteria-1 TaxID=2013854 RepID=A0A2N1PTZ8_9BACT|nr:MAG: hypothetical protein CVV64_03795 [Candidatus Wallbacteria bacterium HGW-Wallbacteria-1]